MKDYTKQNKMVETGWNMNKIFKITLFLSFILFTNQIFASNKIIAEIMTKGVENQKVFLVDKTSKKTFLIDIKNDSQKLIKEFDNIIVGEGNGDKLREGDKKTPTGVYYVIGFITPEKLDKIYGTGAFPLNYPNFVDKLYGKTGHGIWIHGKDPNQNKQASKGCIVLKNEDIDYLKKIDFIGTPVIIAERIHFTDEINYNSEKSFWLNFLNEFYESWKNNDINRLSKLIHARFKDSNHKSYAEYIQRKKMLMEKYPEKTIIFENIKIFKENDTEVVFDFNQYYAAPNIITYGTKRLYLIKEANDFKIIAEEYIPKAIPDRFKNLAKTHIKEEQKPIETKIEPKVEPKLEKIITAKDNEANKIQKKDLAEKTDNTEKMIPEFLEQWRQSWESKDINRYIAFYSNNFRSGNFDYESWKNDKGGKFSRIQTIYVTISNIKTKKINDKTYEVTFIQQYKTEVMNNKGIKTLTLTLEDGKLKIIGELWRAIK